MNFQQVEKIMAGIIRVAFNVEERELIYFLLEGIEVLPYFAKPKENILNKMRNICSKALFYIRREFHSGRIYF